MSQFAFNPQEMLGSMSKGLTPLPIIIGLTSPQMPVPNFVMGVTTEEEADTSNTLPAFQLAAGDLFLKSARNSGTFKFKLIISENPNIKSETFRQVASAIQQIGNVTNAIANFGGVNTSASLSGISSNFAVAQINTLEQMKNGMQPILALNLFMPLSAFSTTNPFLSSFWYISNLRPMKLESERGVIMEIELRELLVKRSGITTIYNIATNLANQLLGPKSGLSIKSVL